MLNGISLDKDKPVEVLTLFETEINPNFQAYELCLKCGGYKWTLGFPPTTGGVMCQCPPEIPTFPIGWVCPICQRVLAPNITEHICDLNHPKSL